MKFVGGSATLCDKMADQLEGTLIFEDFRKLYNQISDKIFTKLIFSNVLFIIVMSSYH